MDITSVTPRDPSSASGHPAGFSFRRVRSGVSSRFLPPAGARLVFRSRAADSLSLPGLPAGFLQAGDAVEAYYDGVRVFRGLPSTWTSRLGRGDTALQDAVVLGPWSVLDRLQYRQQWAAADSGTAATTRVILNQGATADSHLTVAQGLSAILSFAAAAAPDEIAAGTVSVASATLPFDETRDITCAQAADRLLRYFTETVSRVDYSAAGGPPSVSFLRPSPSTDAAWTATVPKSAVRETHDAHPCKGVVLEVETVSTVNGNENRMTNYYCAGTVNGSPVTKDTAGPDILRAYICLEGTATETQYQTIEVEAETVGDITSAAWWISKHPRLSGLTANQVAITDATRSSGSSSSNYPRIATNGAGDLEAFGYHAMAENFTCKAKITVSHPSDSGLVDEEENILLSMMFVTTNATAGTHRRRVSRLRTEGEALPAGGGDELAAAILAQRSGALASAEMDIVLGDSLPRIGDAWSGLVLQEIDIDCAARTASCAFGRPAYLDPGDMRSLMTGFRQRATTRHSRRRHNYEPSASAEDIATGGIPPLRATEWEPGRKTKTAIRASSGAHINLDPSLVSEGASASGNAIKLKPRDVYVVVDDNGTKKAKLAKVLCGEAFGNAADLGGGAPSNPSSTATLGSTAEGSESADQSEWTAGGGKGLKLYVLTRVVYIEGGDKKLYGFKRLLTFDSQGRLYSAGGESRYEIAAAVEATFSL